MPGSLNAGSNDVCNEQRITIFTHSIFPESKAFPKSHSVIFRTVYFIKYCPIFLCLFLQRLETFMPYTYIPVPGEYPKIHQETFATLILIRTILSSTYSQAITKEIHHMMPVFFSEHMMMDNGPVSITAKICLILVISDYSIANKILVMYCPKICYILCRDLFDLYH